MGLWIVLFLIKIVLISVLVHFRFNCVHLYIFCQIQIQNQMNRRVIKRQKTARNRPSAQNRKKIAAFCFVWLCGTVCFVFVRWSAHLYESDCYSLILSLIHSLYILLFWILVVPVTQRSRSLILSVGRIYIWGYQPNALSEIVSTESNRDGMWKRCKEKNRYDRGGDDDDDIFVCVKQSHSRSRAHQSMLRIFCAERIYLRKTTKVYAKQ